MMIKVLCIKLHNEVNSKGLGELMYQFQHFRDPNSL